MDDATNINTDDRTNLIKFFMKKMVITKGARFDAYRRLKRMGNISLVSISLLSIYAIISSLFVFVFSDEIGQLTSKYFTMVSVILASLILFLNAFESSKQYELRSEKMRMSAQRISDLYNEFDAKFHLSIIDDDYLQNTISKYNGILQEFAENHDDVDFLHHRYGRFPAFRELHYFGDDECKERWRKEKRYRLRRRMGVIVNWTVEIYRNLVIFVILPPIAIMAIYFTVVRTMEVQPG